MTYEGFAIECYEAGKGLWHARLRRADPQARDRSAASRSRRLKSASPGPIRMSAAADAKNQIDRLKLKRYAAAAQTPQQELSAA